MGAEITFKFSRKVGPDFLLAWLHELNLGISQECLGTERLRQLVKIKAENQTPSTTTDGTDADTAQASEDPKARQKLWKLVLPGLTDLDQSLSSLA